MVPIWISIHLFATVPFHCIIAVMAIVATISRTRPKITTFDVYFLISWIISVAAVFFGGSSAGLSAAILLRWGIHYFAARVLVSATGVRFVVDVIAILFGVVGVLATLELLLAWHPYAQWSFGSISEFEIWRTVLTREGRDRSTWAFGHSIALGGSLALAIPFILRSSYSAFVRGVLLVSVLAGIVSTASRSAELAAVLTIVICALYVVKIRILRTGILAVGTVAMLVVSLAVGDRLQAWARGNSAEEQSSYEYRREMYANYLPTVKWLGKSPIYNPTKISIDSAFLDMGLGFGWVLLIIAVIPLALSVFRVITGSASFAEIAIVGQIPLFATVALINQYASIVFIVAGIAVQIIVDRQNQPVGDPLDANSFPPTHAMAP